MKLGSKCGSDSNISRNTGMGLIGIQDSRIENNVIDSPVRATLLARPNDETDRQAILLRHNTHVTVQGNLLMDPENHTQPEGDE